MQHKVLTFTDEENAAKKFLESLTLQHGFDIAEDIAGGFQKALEQQWESKTRYAILIADSPAHGTKYHDLQIGYLYERYPEGDPEGRQLEDQILQFADKKI